MEKEEVSYQKVTFRYLMEFRQWLYNNTDKQIIDITTRGEWEEMEYVVEYQTGSNG